MENIPAGERWLGEIALEGTLAIGYHWGGDGTWALESRKQQTKGACEMLHRGNCSG